MKKEQCPAIMVPVSKKNGEKILNGQNPFLFFKKLPNIDIWTKIFLYESGADGCGKVIGEVYMNDFFRLTNEKGEYPFFGAYYFIEYFFKYIRPNQAMKTRYRNIKWTFNNKFEKYKFGFIIAYAMSDADLKNIKEKGEPIDTFREFPFSSYNDPELAKILKDRKDSRNNILECDNWLEEIGFYNDEGCRLWKYAIEIRQATRYAVPKDLRQFTSHGKTIKRCSSEYVYCTERKDG